MHLGFVGRWVVMKEKWGERWHVVQPWKGIVARMPNSTATIGVSAFAQPDCFAAVCVCDVCVHASVCLD